MKPTPKQAYDDRQRRAAAMFARDPNLVEAATKIEFHVRGSDRKRAYKVRLDDRTWKCSCPDWEERQEACKHILSVIRSLDPNPAPVVTLPEYPVSTHSQDWPSYDAAQQAEHPMFDALLWDLLKGVPERVHTGGRKGRPPIPFNSQLFVAVKKVHLAQSSRRVRGLLTIQYQGGKGLLNRVPNYSVPSRVFGRPVASRVLTDLIEQSALPLRELEAGGTVAIDSTGFSTNEFGAYRTEKYEPDRKHQWMKAHLIVGVKTHIVLSVRITDEHGADCPQFIPLLESAQASGFTPADVAADKAYLSRENLSRAEELGVDPFVPFKSNSVSKPRGSPIWRRKYHEFQARREEFDQHYHARSNIESVNSAIKRKLREPLMSKAPQARVAELLAKILAYNIGVIVHEIFEHGIDPGVPGVPRPTLRSLPPTEPSCEFSPESVNKVVPDGPLA
jgi:transposase